MFVSADGEKASPEKRTIVLGYLDLNVLMYASKLTIPP